MVIPGLDPVETFEPSGQVTEKYFSIFCGASLCRVFFSTRCLSDWKSRSLIRSRVTVMAKTQPRVHSHRACLAKRHLHEPTKQTSFALLASFGMIIIGCLMVARRSVRSVAHF